MIKTQKELMAVYEVPEMRLVDDWLISHIPNRLEAIRVCIRWAKKTDKEVAEALHIKTSQFSLIMQGKAHFPVDKVFDLQIYCQNYAVFQYDAYFFNFDIKQKTVIQKQAERIAELEQENSRLSANA